MLISRPHVIWELRGDPHFFPKLVCLLQRLGGGGRGGEMKEQKLQGDGMMDADVGES